MLFLGLFFISTIMVLGCFTFSLIVVLLFTEFTVEVNKQTKLLKGYKILKACFQEQVSMAINVDLKILEDI